MIFLPARRIRILLVMGWLFCAIPGLIFVCPSEAQTSRTFDITLAELDYGERTLRGPVAHTLYYFSLPADWELQPKGNYLELGLDYTVSGREGYAPTLLEVKLNGTVLPTVNLETPGTHRVQIELPLDRLRSAEDKLLNELELNLQVWAECEQAQFTSLVIDASSSLHFEYRERPLQFDLARWPRPLYQWHAFKISPVRLVLPSEPDEVGTRAAIIVAAGLGKLSGDNLSLRTTLASEQMSASFSEEHLIVIGQPDNNPLLRQLGLPLPLVQRELRISSRMPSLVAPGQAFSYTITVENTSSTAQELVVEDRLPPNGTLFNCLSRCQESEPGVLRWDVGRVTAGHQISTVVSVRLDPSASPGEWVEHTASLLDSDGDVINVDTLAAEVGVTEDDADEHHPRVIASASDRGAYFFVHNNRAVAESDGLIQILVSPGSPRHAAIVVTGLSDEPLLKAARALSARTRLPGMSGVYAIVQGVQSVSEVAAEEPLEDLSFAVLGYGAEILSGNILDSLNYTFDLPGEWVPTEDSYLALHFAHSVALVEMSATLEVELNDVPMGSVKLDERNASGTWAMFPLSAPFRRSGRNQLEVQLGIRQDGVCVDQRNTHLWLTVYADSFLHLPHEETAPALYLGILPRPFSGTGDLSDVAFLLPQQPNVEALNGVLRLASRLGGAARGESFNPQVALGGSPGTRSWEGYHLIAVGRPSQNSFIAAANDRLPQPFRSAADEIQQQVDDVVYRLPPGISLGYVQELRSPWDEGRAMLVATGTTDKGVNWALNALTDDELKWGLSGNLVLVRGDEMETMDTREEAESVIRVTQNLMPELTPQATVAPTPTATVEPATPTAQPTVAIGTLSPDQVTSRASAGRPAWLLPLLIVAIATAVGGVGITLGWGRTN